MVKSGKKLSKRENKGVDSKASLRLSDWLEFEVCTGSTVLVKAVSRGPRICVGRSRIDGISQVRTAKV